MWLERIDSEPDNRAIVSGKDKHLFLRCLDRTGPWAHKQPNPCLLASVYSGANDRSVNIAIRLYTYIAKVKECVKMYLQNQ
jgi:hypothetical protein